MLMTVVGGMILTVGAGALIGMKFIEYSNETYAPGNGWRGMEMAAGGVCLFGVLMLAAATWG